MIMDLANDVHIGAASILEIAITHGLGRRGMVVSRTHDAVLARHSDSVIRF